MEAVCLQANVTRGALYHHFPGKEGLFLAVCEEVARDVAARVAEVALKQSDPRLRLRAGCHAFLRFATDDDVRQILLSDAPSVLGWSRFRELDARHGLGLLKAAIQAVIDDGVMEPASADVNAHLLVAALNEAAMMIGRSANPQRARRESKQALDRIISGMMGDHSHGSSIDRTPR